MHAHAASNRHLTLFSYFCLVAEWAVLGLDCLSRLLLDLRRGGAAGLELSPSQAPSVRVSLLRTEGRTCKGECRLLIIQFHLAHLV